MLIDCSYFTKGSRHILNASQGTVGTVPDANAIQVNSAIEAYIAENQMQFLVRMLGSTLGNKIHNYLVCIEEDEEPRHRENFDAVCEQLRESFADYVFFRILRDSNTQSTITGVVRLKCANEYVAPIHRQVNVWNTMVERNRLFAEWCQSKDCNLNGISISSDMVTKINPLNL